MYGFLEIQDYETLCYEAFDQKGPNCYKAVRVYVNGHYYNMCEVYRSLVNKILDLSFRWKWDDPHQSELYKLQLTKAISRFQDAD